MFRVEGLGIRVEGLGFKQGGGFGVEWFLGFRAWGSNIGRCTEVDYRV